MTIQLNSWYMSTNLGSAHLFQEDRQAVRPLFVGNSRVFLQTLSKDVEYTPLISVFKRHYEVIPLGKEARWELRYRRPDNISSLPHSVSLLHIYDGDNITEAIVKDTTPHGRSELLSISLWSLLVGYRCIPTQGELK